ncbi:enoyl- hydratase isomerase family protein [Purpureocillium lavendulum]|uniref:Enoyl- hydratase isomerase family protein n=1 Tax=Purpureocillium lavendulum TaxID=1247861 RepID=A0AB34G2F9_9HYPO|nr:enoyl- hydratase isomerase family protein [Purpureocillium lavendulum]
MADAVLVSKTGEGITTITINRPHRRNAVDPPTAKLLAAAFSDFDRDESQKVCVLHGAGDTFCAGFDLHALSSGRAQTQQPQQDGGTTADEPRVLEEYVPDAAAHLRGENTAPMGPSRMQTSKPIIAAVAGHAVAGGLELSLLADLRVADEDAVFGVFCRRWGVPLIDGGTVRLQAVVGLGRALDMVLTGRPVGAREALQFGLANRVVARGEAVAEAHALARQLLRFPQACMRVDRASCYYAAYGADSFEDAMRFEFANGVGVVASESVEGAARFSGGAVIADVVVGFVVRQRQAARGANLSWVAAAIYACQWYFILKPSDWG